MKYSQARPGRIFVIRLEDGDILHEAVEGLARSEKIQAAAILAVGGADAGSTLIVGPEDGRAERIVPMEHILEGVHELTGTGTLFPDEEGKPVLHMHIACGREDKTVTGCVRRGVRVWQVLELILIELCDTEAVRRLDTATGFNLLQP